MVNCYDSKVQERILCCRNPSLEETLEIAKGTERSAIASKELGKSKSITTDAVNKVSHKSTFSSVQNNKSFNNKPDNKSDYKKPEKKKSGHFAKVCRNVAKVMSLDTHEFQVSSVVNNLIQDKKNCFVHRHGTFSYSF